MGNEYKMVYVRIGIKNTLSDTHSINHLWMCDESKYTRNKEHLMEIKKPNGFKSL